MKFIVIGDSWGRGEWKYEDEIAPYNQGKGIYVLPKTSIGSILESYGHTSITLAKASTKGSNFHQLLRLEEEIKDELRFSTEPIDGIIWFHTETIRDILWTIIPNKELRKKQFPDFTMKDFKKSMEYINTQNYKFAQKIYSEHKIPFYIIGCLSPLSESINNFNFYKFKIDSWISEITGYDIKDLPLNMHSNFFLDAVEAANPPNKNELIDMVEYMIEIESILDNNGMFSAGVHPTFQQLKNLADRILIVANKE